MYFFLKEGFIYMNDYIQYKKKEPLYKQVSNKILEKIENKEYLEGKLLPPERDLCSMFRVSRHTVRRALKELNKAGYIERRQGDGTYVKNQDSSKKLIGVILGFDDQYIVANALKGMEEIFNAEKYKMIIMNSDGDIKKEENQIKELCEEGISGLIIIPVGNQLTNDAIYKLKKEKYPFVLMDRYLQNCKTDCVVSDNIEGGQLAANHLLKMGHKDIGIVVSELDKYNSSGIERIIGCKNILKIDDKKIFYYNKTEEIKAVNDLYKFYIDNNLTAVIAINALMAYYILKMAREKGLSIPGDFSMVSFGDDYQLYRDFVQTPQTVIIQQPEKMGKLTAKLLIDKINKKREKSQIQQIYIPVDLLIRQSVKKIN